MLLSGSKSKLTEISSPLRRLTAPLIASVFVSLISVLVLSGWLFDIDLLRRIVPGYVVMNPTTAAAFVLASIALLLLHSADTKKVRIAQACAVVVLLVGVVKLCQIFELFDVGIDQIFFARPFVDSVTGQPNRMAPTTAFNFLLAGAALLLFRVKSKRRFFYPAQYPALAVFLISLVAVVGYVYNAKAFYVIFSFNPMAIHTAVSFLALAGGLLLSKDAQGIVKEIFNPDISERTAKELANFKFALDQSSIVAVSDRRGRIIYVNDKFCEISKYSRAELYGQDHRINSSGRHPKEFIKNLWETITSGEVWHGEIQNRAKDDSLYWIDMTIVPFLDADGTPYQYVAISSDTTARKESEQSLGASEKSYRQLADAMPQIVWTANADGALDYYNQRWFDYTAMTLEQTLGWGWEPVLHPNDLQNCLRVWSEALETGEHYKVEYRFKRGSDGEYRWHLGQALPVRDENGEVIKWFGTCTDIHEQKKVEEQLRHIQEDLEQRVERRTADLEHANRNLTEEIAERARAQEKMRQLSSIVESSDDAIVSKDLNGVITSWNRGAERLYKYAAEEIIGKNISLLFPPGREAEEPLIMERIKRGESVEHYETVRVKKDGDLLDLSLTISPIKNAAGEITGASKIARDITERKRAEEDLKTFAAKLERSNTELQDFASVASHDLQEPLRKIQAFGDRLKAKSGDELSDVGLDYLERMQNAAGRMQTLINDLLTFSRVESKAKPFVPVNMQRIAREVLSDLETLVKTTNASVEIGELGTIDAEPTQMRQLLQNLIGNALKFNRAGVPPIVKISGQISRRIASEKEEKLAGASYCLTVEDNGIGFDEKYADKIFKVFQRLHGRSEYEGTGIGLAVCRKIAERHGGGITAHSTLGVGATFVVDLPIKQSEKVEIKPARL